MKSISLIILAAFLTLPIISNAATDWAPKFDPMLNGCGYIDLDYQLEPIYKSAIAKKTHKVSPIKGSEEERVHDTVLFKNSIAFGQPIQRFELYSLDGGYNYTLYFKNNDFVKLRPLFKLPTDTEGQEIKKTSTGYETPVFSLKFNTKDKSITCHGYSG